MKMKTVGESDHAQLRIIDCEQAIRNTTEMARESYEGHPIYQSIEINLSR